jgi:translation elongation factor EF-4
MYHCPSVHPPHIDVSVVKDPIYVVDIFLPGAYIISIIRVCLAHGVKVVNVLLL